MAVLYYRSQMSTDLDLIWQRSVVTWITLVDSICRLVHGQLLASSDVNKDEGPKAKAMELAPKANAKDLVTEVTDPREV